MARAIARLVLTYLGGGQAPHGLARPGAAARLGVRRARCRGGGTRPGQWRQTSAAGAASADCEYLRLELWTQIDHEYEGEA